MGAMWIAGRVRPGDGFLGGLGYWEGESGESWICLGALWCVWIGTRGRDLGGRGDVRLIARRDSIAVCYWFIGLSSH